MSLKKSSRGYRAACYAFAGLVGVALLLAAFYAGLIAAPQPTAEDQLPSDDVPAAGEPVEPDATVPTSIEDGVSVSWFPADAQESRPYNYFVRGLWEKSLPNDGATLQYSATVLGTVNNADFEGDYLVAETVAWDPDSLGGGAMTAYVIEHEKDDRDPVILTKYLFNEATFGPFSTYGTAQEEAVVAAIGQTAGIRGSDATIAGLETPYIVTDRADNSYALIGLTRRVSPEAAANVDDYHLTSIPTNDIDLREFDGWKDNGLQGMVGTFFHLRPDGRLAYYDLTIPFWEAAGESSNDGVRQPNVTWNLGTNFADGYLKGFIGGCGVAAPTNVQYDLDASLLTRTGTVDGQPVYEYADYAGTDDLTNWQFSHQEQTVTASQFAAMHPSFFYKDGLGRWVKFTGASVIPPGECGKPVIYLYPTTTTDLSITLAPQGGFTKSEPAYGNGWNVTASPNGSLVNKADGVTYPYLFWEGRGGYYAAPTKYWVVAKADVHGFLITTLATLGLNAKETADFLEFWEPRMQAAPYYQIGFHGTSVMNQIAPLTVSQTPDTLVRILMDYSELSAPIAPNPPQLPPTPVRNGFTVIEWGGVIR